MDLRELDDLKQNFENALQHWIKMIQRLEHILANTSHSARSETVWEKADFDLDDAQNKVKEAKKAYEDAVREANFGF